MALKEFVAAELMEIDGGRVREAIDLAIKHCRADVADRPNLKDKRRVVVEIVLEPVPEDGTVDVSFGIDHKLPKKKSRGYNMALDEEDGALVFNEVSPDTVRQRTLDDAGRGPQGKVEGGAS